MATKNDTLILALLKEVRDEQRKATMSMLLIQQDVKLNADDLVEHMAQTKAVRELVKIRREEVDLRLEKLEEPRKVIKFVQKLVIGIGAIAISILGILRLLNYL